MHPKFSSEVDPSRDLVMTVLTGLFMAKPLMRAGKRMQSSSGSLAAAPVATDASNGVTANS